MKYLTIEWLQEWWEVEDLKSWLKYVRADERFVHIDEEKFEEVYQKKFGYIGCPPSGKGLSAKKRKEQEQRYLENKERVEAQFNKRMKFCQSLPKDILDEIEDLRIFCVGYTTKKVKEKLSLYVNQRWEEVDKWKKIAETQRAKAVATLAMPFHLMGEDRCMVIGLKKVKNNIYIDFRRSTLIIEDAVILQRSGKIIRKISGNDLELCTAIEEWEMHKVEDGYEIHFLMCNHEKRWSKYWCLTIRGKNIRLKRYESPKKNCLHLCPGWKNVRLKR